MIEPALYLVATPIGNLGDLSPRAVEVLKASSCVLCEDTRHSQRLFKRLEFERTLLSCHEHNETGRIQQALDDVASGKVVSLISDAGTPAISDPGFRIVRAFRAAGQKVISIPGPCAAIAAIAASGLPTDQFRYLGFLPPKSAARLRNFETLKDASETLVFYESTHRILKFLKDLRSVVGDERIVCVARELTKMHETTHTGPLLEVEEAVTRGSQKGEFVVLIAREGYSLT